MCNKECDQELKVESQEKTVDESLAQAKVMAAKKVEDCQLQDLDKENQSETISFADLIKRVETAGTNYYQSVLEKNKEALLSDEVKLKAEARLSGAIDFIYWASKKILATHLDLKDLVDQLEANVQRLGINKEVFDIKALEESVLKQQEILTDFLGEILCEMESLFKASKSSLELVFNDTPELEAKKKIDLFFSCTKSLEKEAKPAINKMVVFSSRLQHALTCKISVLSRCEKVVAPQATV